MQAFIQRHDAMGRPSSAIPLAGYCCVVRLAAGQAKLLAVPAEATIATFNATAPFWLKADSAPLLPTTDILDGSAPELSPAVRDVAGVQNLGMVSPEPCFISLSFYR